VPVVPEMRHRRDGRLVRAIAGSRGPGELERQQQRKEEEDEARHLDRVYVGPLALPNFFMTASIQIGPLLIPTALLILLLAAGAGVLIAKRMSRQIDGGVESDLWRMVLVGVVVARLAFVYQFRAGYSEAPLDVLDLRDGGWDPQTGIIAIWLYTLLRTRRRRPLRKPLLWGLAATSAVFAVGSIALAIGSAKEMRLSSVSLPTFDGQTASLTDYQGKPTVVNLWATWCPPCRRELPLLQQAQAAHPEVHFVFLNQGESAGLVRGFLSANRYDLKNVLLDPKGQAGAQFGSGALPTTLLFDARGQLVGTHLGELSRGTLAASLSKLGVPAAPAP
jgi:thiol-disulfide isomerase/thioredoxin